MGWIRAVLPPLYLPPSNTNNALFLKTVRDMLVFTHVDAAGHPEELLLAHFTPRLVGGRADDPRRASANAFGPVSFTIHSRLAENLVEAEVQDPPASRHGDWP
ncbi:MAG: hypothetical protein R3C56_15185 [Pirellulaceae bacterium]